MKRAFLISWGFAVAVSLINLGTLWPLIAPPFALVSFVPWRAFLLGPIGVAVLVGLLSSQARCGVVAVNFAFWLSFFAAAEAWSSRLMGQSLPLQTTCVETHSFLHSLMIAGHEYQFTPHAAYVTGEKVMLWSYAELSYWEALPAAYKNLDFTDCRASVQALLERPL